MTPLSPPDLANTITGFCTIAGGVVPLLFCRWLGPHPARWMWAYTLIVVTGIPTVGYHAYGGSWWRVGDTGTNLLLVFGVHLAVLGDFYARSTQLRVGVVSGLINAFGVAWMIGEEIRGEKTPVLPFGDFGGFYLGELILIADSIFAFVLFGLARRHLSDAVVPVLKAVGVAFFIGMILASARNDALSGRFGSWHALWHIASATGFLFLWAFNHLRFVHRPRQGAGSTT